MVSPAVKRLQQDLKQLMQEPIVGAFNQLTIKILWFGMVSLLAQKEPSGRNCNSFLYGVSE